MLGSKVTILMYHSVHPTPGRFSITPQVFERHLDVIQEHYPIVPLSDIRRHLATRGERKIVITFDDAFVDFFEYAYPALGRRRIPCTVFVPTAQIGGWNAWDAHRPQVVRRRIMGADQLKALSSDALVQLGSHSADHVSMGRLSATQMRHQAASSRRCLEDLLQRPVTMFAYPYGDYGDFTKETEEALRACGYDLAVTTRWGSRNSPKDIYRLRRISFANDTTLRSIRARIEGFYDWKDMRDWARFTLRSARKRFAALSQRPS